MPTTIKILVTTAAAALPLALAGCGTAPTAPIPAEQTKPGVTQITQMYGPRCNQVPLSGPGSPVSMATEPVGLAMDHSPMLTRLDRQLRIAGLETTLNKPGSGFTVFAPAGSAFEPMFNSGDLGQLDSARSGGLRKLLSHHIVPKRYDAQGLLAAGTVSTLDGSPLTISGDGLDLSIGGQRASVLCGGIPTANATVFIIDHVLTPPPPTPG
jgi:uncharacterized surface protein with fasciclin (FAS1) repeats